MHSHDVRWTARTTNGEEAYNDGCNPPGSSAPQRWNEIQIGEPTSIEHAYTNYIKGSPDTMMRRTGTRKDFVIPEYPKVYDLYRMKRFMFIGIGDARIEEWNAKLDEVNAEIGKKKHANVIVIVAKEGDTEWSEAVKERWIGGKKNDFIVVVGAPSYPKVSWVSIVSWSKSEDAKIAVRDKILKLNEFDGTMVASIVHEEINDKFLPCEMKDFEYLKARIEPGETTKIVIFILV